MCHSSYFNIIFYFTSICEPLFVSGSLYPSIIPVYLFNIFQIQGIASAAAPKPTVATTKPTQTTKKTTAKLTPTTKTSTTKKNSQNVAQAVQASTTKKDAGKASPSTQTTPAKKSQTTKKATTIKGSNGKATQPSTTKTSTGKPTTPKMSQEVFQSKAKTFIVSGNMVGFRSFIKTFKEFLNSGTCQAINVLILINRFTIPFSPNDVCYFQQSCQNFGKYIFNPTLVY